MQDVQNIPNPDVDSVETDDFGSHSDVMPDTKKDDDKREGVESPSQDTPVPPDSRPQAPVEEPPEQKNLPPIDEDNEDDKPRLV